MRVRPLFLFLQARNIRKLYMETVVQGLFHMPVVAGPIIRDGQVLYERTQQ